MKGKLCGLVLMAMMLFTLTGCRMYADYAVNEDQTVTITSKIAYPESMKNTIDTTNMKREVLEDGNAYYVEEEATTESLEETNKRGICLSEDIFFYRMGLEDQDADASASMYMQLTVHLRGDIVDTNADVSVSNEVASFSTDGKLSYWYAYTQKGKDLVDADTEFPKMNGAKNKKYYKKMPTNIRFIDNIAVKNVMLNGQYVSSSSSTVTLNGKEETYTTWKNSQGRDVSKVGKNEFKVTDLKGNTSTFIIYIDKKVPVVKGVKNKKTYKNKAVIYVKDNKKLSKVTINGKKQKITKKQLVKKGKYKGYYKYTAKKKGTNKIVVKDAAGNKKTLKFTIKK